MLNVVRVIIFIKTNTMERTKSKENPENVDAGRMSSNIFEVWKADINWSGLSKKDRNICICFALSFCSVFLLWGTWLTLPSIGLLAMAASNLYKVPLEE